MRDNPKWLENQDKRRVSTRFEGTTTPRVAWKYFAGKENGHILECGPHTGMFTKLLLEKGFKNVHTVDFFDALHFVSKKDIDFKILDLNEERLPYQDNFFDGVTAWGIIEHMENPFLFMREIHRSLKPDGYFIAAIPNPYHIMSRLIFLKRGEMPRWSYGNNHIFVFTKGIFKKTYLRYFDLVETIYTQPAIEYPVVKMFNRFLPANEWFGNYVVWVLRKKSI